MAAKRDLYEVLGISKTADEKTIKKAYRKLAKKYHPDMNPGDKTAEQKFKEATDAYNILSDPEKRKLHADISISFDEAVTGCDKVIHLQDQNGAMQSLQVHIPAGIDTGKSVRLRGKGNPGIGGGEAGDLFLKVTVGEKQGFERKGNDVYTTINVPFSTAVCGGEAVIKTLYGNVICKIKEGTQSGSKIRLRGKGMPLMKNPSQKGDQYAVVQIQVPRNVSQQAKNKLKEFEALCGQRGNASY